MADHVVQHENKVVAVTITKIESDIIESFVRHTLSFADELLVADNGSADGTAAILRKLCAEGLPVTVERVERIAFAHAEMMQELWQKAVYEHGADLVLPLDVDEFLVCHEEGTDCRALLRQLDPSLAYRLQWRKYAPSAPCRDATQFLLALPCVREAHWQEGYGKILLGAQLDRQGTLRLAQGCHFAYWQGQDGSTAEVPMLKLPQLHVAHFHWRSDERYMAKVMVGWPSTVAKYTEHTCSIVYLKDSWKRIAAGEPIHAGDVWDDPETEPYDLRPFCRMQAMRYGADARLDVLPILMAENIRFAEAYAEAEFVQRRVPVDIVVPFTGDAGLLQRTLAFALRQDYPCKTVYVCNLSGQRLQQQRQDVVLLEPKGSHTALDRLGAMASGEYVQWLLPAPGRKALPERHVRRLAAAWGMQDIPFSAMIADQGAGSDELFPYLELYACEAEGILNGEAAYLRKLFLVTGKCPSNGLDDALFHRRTMQQCRWFRDCVDSGELSAMAMWNLLLKQLEGSRPLGIYRDELRRRNRCSLESYIRHQIQWFHVLDAEQGILSDGELGTALQNFLRNRDVIEQHAELDSVAPELLRCYRLLVRSLEQA